MQSLVDPSLFFHDLPASEAEKWKSRLLSHPGDGWDKTVQYAGWQDVPVDYIVADLDRCIPSQLQEQFASAAKARVHHIQAGHMAQLSQPEELGRIITSAIRIAE